MDSNDTQSPEEDRPAEESSATVGAMLKGAREELDLSIEQISGELRIEPRFLSALEEDNFEDFPAPVFTKGYIKQYGQRLGLEYADLLAEYYRQAEVRDVPMMANRPIRLRDEQQISQWVVASLILATLVVGFGIWYLSNDAPPVEVTSPSEAPDDPGMNEETVVEAPPPDLPEESVPAPDPALGSGPEAVVVPEPGSSEEPAVLEQLGADAAIEPQPAAVPVGSAVEPVAELADAAVPDLPPGPTVEVTISFEQDCWTEVTDARGERFFYGLGSAGAVSSFDAQLPLSFFLGNAGGVGLQINGTPYPIPADSRQGNLARFVIAEGP